MTEQQPAPLTSTGKPITARQMRRYRRRFVLAMSLGDIRRVDEDGTVRTVWRGMPWGPRRAWIRIRLWLS